VINHLDDLRVESYKVDEVEKNYIRAGMETEAFQHELQTVHFILFRNDHYMFNLDLILLLLLL
jgi:hypothetical protein